MKNFSFKFLMILMVGMLRIYSSNGQDYCSISVTSTGNEYISEFNFSNVINVSGDNGYTNYSSTQTIVVYPGANYQPKVTLKKSVSTDLLCCWIDWNQNKVFEITEKYNFTVVAAAGTSSITVPVSANIGKTRLRLMLKGSSSIDPCTSFRYGEVEDYEVDVQQVSFPPVANFKADIVKPFVGQSVSFTDQSTALPTSWLWEITPSTFEFVSSSASSQNPVVKFQQAGLYTVKLKATNSFGFDDTTQVDYINVCNYPVAQSLSANTEGSWVDLSWNAPNISGKKNSINYQSDKGGQFANIGYKIYRDNTPIKTITNNIIVKYRDSLVPDGLHSYFVKAVYQNPDGESLSSNVADVNVNNSLPEVHANIQGKHLESGETFFIPKNVMVAEMYTIKIGVSNSSNSLSLIIGTVTTDNPEFAITQALPSQILAGATDTLIIQFTPTTEGDKIANLSITNNDSNENPFTTKLTAVAGPVEWTWMVYMLEDYTQLDGEKDVNEWEINGSIPGKVNYLVFWDAQDDAKDGIWLVKKDTSGKVNYELYSEKVSSEFGVDFDMSKYQTLQNFLLWAAQKYPAKHYGLTMWDHGSGIFKKGGVDNGITKDFCGGMKLWEMEKAVSAFTASVGKKIDIIGFDVCLLGQIETVYQLAPYCNYVIASPKTEPGDGWDYDAGFKPLNQNPKMSIVDLVKNLVYSYIDAYKPGGSAYPAVATQAATSTTELMQNVIPSLNNLSTELKNWVYYFKPQIKSARDNAWAAPSQQGYDNPDHRDLMGFAKNLMNITSLPSSLHNAASDLVNKLNNAIVANSNNGVSAANSNGLKIFIPNDITTQGTSQVYYMDPTNYLKFSNTSWDEFLYMFANPIVANVPNFVKPSSLTAQIQDDNDVLLIWEKPQIDSQGDAILSQGFEGSTWPPIGWEVMHGLNMDGSGLSAPTAATWLQCNIETFGTNPNPEQYLHSGLYSAAIGYTAPELNWLITPSFAMKADYDLYYWMWYANDNQFHTNFYVKVLADGVWSNLKQYGSSSPSNLYSSEERIDLESYVGKTVRIAFVYEYTDGFQLALDDIRIAKGSKNGSKIISNSKLMRCLPIKSNDHKLSSSENSGSMGIWVSYKIYRNGTLVSTIEDIGTTSWKDMDVVDGSYNYEVSANYITPNGESTKCGPASVIINHTSIEETSILTNLQVFPNPNSGLFEVKLNSVNDFEWTITSISGVVMKMGRSNDSVLTISGLKAGIYFLNIKLNSSSKTIKVIVI